MPSGNGSSSLHRRSGITSWRVQNLLVWTGHLNLEYLQITKCLNPSQVHWGFFLRWFNFSLSYHPGSMNGTSYTHDYMSLIKENPLLNESFPLPFQFKPYTLTSSAKSSEWFLDDQFLITVWRRGSSFWTTCPPGSPMVPWFPTVLPFRCPSHPVGLSAALLVAVDE